MKTSLLVRAEKSIPGGGMVDAKPRRHENMARLGADEDYGNY